MWNIIVRNLRKPFRWLIGAEEYWAGVMNRNENEIIELVKNGDEDAFAMLMNTYKAITYMYIDRYSLLYPNLLDRKELYQLSLMSLYNSASSYDPGMENAFSTYYAVLLEHDILMHLRMLATDKHRSNLNTISLDGVIAETDGVYLVDTLVNKNEKFSPEKYVDNDALYQQITTCLSNFSSKEADVFRMWMRGYSYSEISKKHQISEKSVEYTIRKIRVQMRNSLKEWY